MNQQATILRADSKQNEVKPKGRPSRPPFAKLEPRTHTKKKLPRSGLLPQTKAGTSIKADGCLPQAPPESGH